jgi:hypothetical protein
MQDCILVSVITTAYDRADFLEKVTKSIIHKRIKISK